MFKNYFLTMIRTLKRFKGYYLLNISSLAVGIACCIIIFSYLSQETSYDKFFQDSERIYRVAMKARISERYMETASVMPALIPNMKEHFAEVEDGTRILRLPRPIFMSYGENGFYEEGVLCVDQNFFDIFSFEILEGSKDDCFATKDQIVLTETTARKYFGEESALGKTIRSNNMLDLNVSAVIADPPKNTHLQFNMLRSMELIRHYYGEEFMNHTTRLSIHSYVKMKGKIDIDMMNAKLYDLINTMNDNKLEEYGISMRAYLQKLTDIHLHSNLLNEIAPNGRYSHILIFTAVALFILIIAVLNFVNLSTVISTRRYKEISVRKICGSSRNQLRLQFIYESVLLVMFSVVIALGMVEFFTPYLEGMTNIDIGMGKLITTKNFLILGAFSFVTGIISGIYPAFNLTSRGSLKLIQSADHKKGSRSIVRNALVILQFIIAVLLISSIFIINNQLKYIQEKDIGFRKDQLAILHLPQIQVRDHGASFLQEVGKISGIKSASGISSKLLGIYWDRPYMIDDMEELQLIASIDVDQNFVETMDMNLLSGRNFSSEINDELSVIVNEDLVKEFGWEEPLDKIITEQVDEENVNLFRVIGVMADYHYHSLHDRISPTMLKYNTNYFPHILVRLDQVNTKQTLQKITSLWDKIGTGMNLEYSFIDEEFYSMHQSEFTMGKLFVIFTVLSVLIACIGLIGLVSYVTEMRTKEVCIRKVFGSSTGAVMKLLTADLLKNVLFANLIGLPLTWFVINKWLENFAYKAEINIISFILAGILSLLIALITVSFHTLKAANSNPVKSLKYE
ncbi:ABC transporter permease [Candidatus Cloacimonadota bacterium]